VADFGALWARSGSSLWHISLEGSVVARIPNVFSDKRAAVDAQSLAAGAGSIWTVQPRTVLRIDPSTGRVVARIDTARGCDQIVPGPDVMFLGCRDSRLFRVDPGSNRPTLVATVGVSPIGIAYGHDSVWWIDASEAGGVAQSLRTIAHTGRWPFVVVALGLIAYGVYELVNARYRNIRVAG